MAAVVVVTAIRAIVLVEARVKVLAKYHQPNITSNGGGSSTTWKGNDGIDNTGGGGGGGGYIGAIGYGNGPGGKGGSGIVIIRYAN